MSCSLVRTIKIYILNKNYFITFEGIDLRNKSATTLVCTECANIQWFLVEPTSGLVNKLTTMLEKEYKKDSSKL